MRPIDADALKQQFVNKLVAAGVSSEFAEEFAKTAFKATFKVIDTQPTIEAEPNSCEYWDSESHFCALRRPQAEPITLEKAIDYLHSIGWMQEHDRILTEPTTHEWEWCHDCKEYDHEEHCCHRWTKVIRNTVEELRTDYVPIKHGRWDVDKSGYPSIVCSECGVTIPMVAGWCMDAHINYCPNCGAKMDEVKE